MTNQTTDRDKLSDIQTILENWPGRGSSATAAAMWFSHNADRIKAHLQTLDAQPDGLEQYRFHIKQLEEKLIEARKPKAVDLAKVKEALEGIARESHYAPVDTEACSYYAGTVQTYQEIAAQVLAEIAAQEGK